MYIPMEDTCASMRTLQCPSVLAARLRKQQGGGVGAASAIVAVGGTIATQAGEVPRAPQRLSHTEKRSVKCVRKAGKPPQPL